MIDENRDKNRDRNRKSLESCIDVSGVTFFPVEDYLEKEEILIARYEEIEETTKQARIYSCCGSKRGG